MRTVEAAQYFGSKSALAAELTKAGFAISQPSVAAWKEFPPDVRQIQIERITNGELRAEPECKARLGLPVSRTRKPKAD